jgi:hypothetical protein
MCVRAGLACTASCCYAARKCKHICLEYEIPSPIIGTMFATFHCSDSSPGRSPGTESSKRSYERQRSVRGKVYASPISCSVTMKALKYVSSVPGRRRAVPAKDLCFSLLLRRFENHLVLRSVSGALCRNKSHPLPPPCAPEAILSEF